MNNNPHKQILVDLYHIDNFTYDSYGYHLRSNRTTEATTKAEAEAEEAIRKAKDEAEINKYNKLRKQWIKNMVQMKVLHFIMYRYNGTRLNLHYIFLLNII